jgi:hypothetical protein
MYVVSRIIVTNGVLSEFVPPIANQARPARAVPQSARKLFDLICPGDFIKLKLLGPSTIQFSGRFNSVDTDTSFWQSPSLAGKEWQFPYRPAIVASVKRNAVVHKGRKGITLSVYPLMLRKEGLDGFPEHIRSRYIALDASSLSADSRAPEVEPKWTIANTYIYNTCATLTVSVDPYLMSVSRSHHFGLFGIDHSYGQHAEIRPIYWRLQGSQDLMKVTEQLKLVRPPLDAGLEVRPEDRDETIGIKRSKRHILQTVLAEISPLTLADVRAQDVVWSGRNGWLKEYNQIGNRRDREWEGSNDGDSSEEYDSDYIYDGISPPGERRKSCTVNVSESDETNFE